MENNLTRKELAEAIDVSVRPLEVWERNVYKPRGKNMEKLGEFFGSDGGGFDVY